MKYKNFTYPWKTIVIWMFHMMLICPGGQSSMIKLYQYFPHEKFQWIDPYHGKYWKFIHNNPRRPYRFCTSDWRAGTYITPWDVLERGLTEIFVLKFSLMFEEYNGDVTGGAFGLNDGSGLLQNYTKVRDGKWRNVTWTIQQHWRWCTKRLVLPFIAKMTCMNICCLEVYGKPRKAVIVPVGNALNCTLTSELTTHLRVCDFRLTFEYQWMANLQYTTGKDSFYPISGVGTYSCVMKTENCQQRKCLAGSDLFYVKKKCEPQASNCCEIGRNCGRISHVKGKATRAAIEAPIVIVLVAFWIIVF